MLSATSATSTSTTRRTRELTARVERRGDDAVQAAPAPRAANQIAAPGDQGEGEQHECADERRPPLRKTEMASSGPNSPTAPSAITATPNGVRSSPESRSTGMIVPSAVDVRAMPTNAAAEGWGANSTAIPNPAASEMIHPIAARRAADRGWLGSRSRCRRGRRASRARTPRGTTRNRRARSSPAAPARAAGRARSRRRRAGSRSSRKGHAREGRHDGDRRDEHQRSDRHIHLAPPVSSPCARALAAMLAERRSLRTDDGCRGRAFRPRNIAAVSSWDARPAGENHRGTQCQPGHRPSRAGALSDRLHEGLSAHDGRCRVHPRHQRQYPRRGSGGSRLAVVDEVEAGTVAAADVERAVGAESEVACGMAWVLLAPIRDQRRRGRRGVPAGRERASRPVTTQPSPVAPGGSGQGSPDTPAVPHTRRVAPGHRVRV